MGFASDNITINCKNFETLVNYDWNLAAFSLEIIKFKRWGKLDTDTYKISEIVKGEFATQNLIHSHLHHENFILLKKNFNIIPVAKKYILKSVTYHL
ncbi:hypothetical protein REIP_0152 [Rickettsia endosymbiont of Ixodes pacificus]|uniref:hypothetical protein n=1 Tax=Rickettsia endosymbiont of Ixodes pacificus TaxID=1133329 RepID=UPI00061DFB53|nr:hypothetical protein [Rickettsia endosymbiont of Ixodes pacificus]KJW02149.1 hypothetical protein REIP_0152 [Rickettsia endosymbiont of Ixodes pacificus]